MFLQLLRYLNLMMTCNKGEIYAFITPFVHLHDLNIIFMMHLFSLACIL